MKKKLSDYQLLILASLLHDIGKFYQRTGAKFDWRKEGDNYDYENFTRKIRDGQSTKYSHVHGAYTAKFFREYLSQYDEAGVIAACHHVPENAINERQKFLAKLLTLADRMSSGERVEREEDEESGKPAEEPLTSIFSQIKLEGKEGKGKKDFKENRASEIKEFYTRLSPLDRTLNGFFPVDSRKEAFHNLSGQEAYKKLWNEFIKELNLLNKDEILSSIYYLLLKYTLAIPSAVYREKPDISLFHHLKSTAAIAACLYLLSEERGLREFESKIDNILRDINNLKTDEVSQALKKSSHLADKDFLLVGGDISGIQDFIYQITSENALKGLRGRSAYLQMISEILARKILLEFDLPEANLIYCGGGNFYLLVPKLRDSEDRLSRVQMEMDQILLRAHKGKVAAILSWIPVSYENFFLDFASLWQDLGCSLSLSKRRKFASLLASENPEQFREFVLGPFDQGGERKGCSICGEEIEPAQETCSFCDSLISFSNDLVKAVAILIKSEDKKPLPQKDIRWYHVPQALGFRYQFLSADEDAKIYRNSLVINSTDFAGKFQGFTFIARKVRGADRNVLTLENMARRASGIEKWGVLRADVDNLGFLFREGLEKNKTISRVSMLSSMLSLYFNARIAQLDNWMPKNNGHGLADDVYVAYSGGDDLFLIGPWSDLHKIAEVIYDDFRRFSCYRLTLSAGIFYAPRDKFPIYQAAKKAGEAEEIAKNNGKNRLSLFGEALEWNCLEKINRIIDLILSLLKGKNGREVPRSLLSVLYNIYLEKENKKEKKRKGEIYMERVWRLHYALKKLVRKLDDQQKKDLEQLINLIVINYEIYPYLNIATRVADYLTRKE
ncbi:MAG: type III-A CRISPR-associated protein Cas10/Csm1 [Candidatus Aminicenantes bacterium]|nr:type III-A CRISPR-associated protein Cas10/Csm1 [Candidatus Aminicenantes bacterium]